MSFSIVMINDCRTFPRQRSRMYDSDVQGLRTCSIANEAFVKSMLIVKARSHLDTWSNAVNFGSREFKFDFMCMEKSLLNDCNAVSQLFLRKRAGSEAFKLFGVRSGSVRIPFRVRSEFVRRPFGVQKCSKSIRDSFGLRSESSRESVRDPFGVHLGTHSVRN